MRPARTHFDAAIRYALYPLLASFTLAYLGFELAGPQAAIGSRYGWYLGILVAAMVLIEARHGLRPEWGMTWVSFSRRDLPFLVLGGLTVGFANFIAAGVVTAHALTSPGMLAGMPVLPGVLVSILITDFIWYWIHRISHEANRRLGRFLWNVHVAHHLPRQVYVLMHGVAHPVNTLIVRAILALPPYFLGLSAEVVFVASVIIGFQGLVAHFNVDSRVGWLNYLLVGTELHRYHHSADMAEAGNYGAVVSVWDQLFGTFVYRPTDAPRALGISEPGRHPADTQVMSILLEPFRLSDRRSHDGLASRDA
jgi:sterol desaturase/sphingolipid hydroxylase (fatty acid hydroxylase superfamily)